jgi:transcription elongation GreA/GreB family factor
VVEAPASTGTVEFGSTVTIKREDGHQQTFRIVGIDEADPSRGTLSHISPLAKALIGKEKGDEVTVGGSRAEIIEIK